MGPRGATAVVLLVWWAGVGCVGIGLHTAFSCLSYMLQMHPKTHTHTHTETHTHTCRHTLNTKHTHQT